MDIIDDWLDEDSKSSTLRSPIREAAQLAKKTLNKHYEKTDQSNAYQITMVLHPKHKLMFFKNAGWEKAWIDTAEELVREEFDRHYGVDKDQIDIATADPAAPSPKVSCFFTHYKLLSHACQVLQKHVRQSSRR